MSDEYASGGHGAFLPIGSVVMWAGDPGLVPNGWLICDGGLYKREQYPALFKVVKLHFGGDSNKGESFHVPDLRGRFVRGVDTTAQGTPRDPDRDSRVSMFPGGNTGAHVGSLQGDALRSHDHEYQVANGTEKNGLFAGSHWRPAARRTGSTGGSETRPVNAYLFFIIKAA